MLHDGLAWLERQMLTSCASAVEYRRGSQQVIAAAVFGKTDYQTMDVSGVQIGGSMWDFLIDAQALPFTPQAGDTIAVNGLVFEVMPLGDDGCWRWSSPARTALRIHTKQV